MVSKTPHKDLYSTSDLQFGGSQILKKGYTLLKLEIEAISYFGEMTGPGTVHPECNLEIF